MSGRISAGFPHSFRTLTISGIYWRLSFAVSIPCAAAVLRGGFPAFLVLLAAVMGTTIADMVFSSIITGPENPGRDGRALYYGLILASLLPVATDPLTAGIAGAITIAAGLWIPGGPGRYWVHPALVGIALGGVALSGSQGVSDSAALFALPFADVAAPAIERVLFEPLGVRVPDESWRLLFGVVGPEGGSLTLGLLAPVILGSFIVFGEDLQPPVVPIVFGLVFSFAVWVGGALPGAWGGGAPLDAWFTSNALFVIVFLLADPGARPRTRRGMVLFGVLFGLLAAVLWISERTAAPVVVALFVSEMFIPLLDRSHSGSLHGRVR